MSCTNRIFERPFINKVVGLCVLLVLLPLAMSAVENGIADGLA